MRWLGPPVFLYRLRGVFRSSSTILTSGVHQCIGRFLHERRDLGIAFWAAWMMKSVNWVMSWSMESDEERRSVSAEGEAKRGQSALFRIHFGVDQRVGGPNVSNFIRMGSWLQRSEWVLQERWGAMDVDHKIKSIVEKEPLDTQKCVGVLWVFIKVRLGSFSKRCFTAVLLLFNRLEPHV